MSNAISGPLTVGDRITTTGGRTTGFDYLRVGLAVSVVLWHTVQVSYGQTAANIIVSGPFRPVIAIILPAFFALSGFLVAGSLERNTSLIRFGSLRILRIVPALAVEVVLSALILGPILTTLTLAQYFSDPILHHYFLNILGMIHFTLPGLFADNPYPRIVNRQLWTIPFELKCYLTLAALAGFGIVKRRWLFLIAVLALQAIDALEYFTHLNGHPVGYPGISGWKLVLSFLDGVLIYRFRDLVLYRASWFVVAMISSFVLLSVPLGDLLMAFPVTYLIVYVGLLNPKRNILVRFGDLSYGIFLYGFAVQQVVATWGAWTHVWYVNALLTLPIVSAIACFSWYLIEKPALELRKHLGVFDPVDAWIGKSQRQILRPFSPGFGRLTRSGLAAKLFSSS